MYTIIGGDGREYGPVTAEQVRSWIAGGRANLDTKVKAAGTEEWRRIADVPEITGVTGTGGTPAGAAATAIAQLPAVARDLDIISCYERSWNLLKSDFWPLVGVSFVIILLLGVLGYGQHRGVFFTTPLFGGVLTGGWQTSKETAYVQATRARHGTDWHLDNCREFREILGVVANR